MPADDRWDLTGRWKG